jgi:mevalonate kinase
VVAEVALPSAAGLGCSAALGVAVVGALDEVFGVTRTPEERGSVALAWERVFHGNPSGIDNTMAACGGVAVYRRGHPLVPVSLPGPLWLVLASSGEPSSTKAMVEGVARLHRRSPETTEKTFDAIGVLVEEARDALEASRLARVGQLMNLNQTLLSSLLLSTARLEEMCEVARNSGALGAKLTGAGGGGCIVALVPDHAHAETVCEALTAAGSEAFTAAVGEQPAEGPTAGGQTA